KLIDENQAVLAVTIREKNLLKKRKMSKHMADAIWFTMIEKPEYKTKGQCKHLAKIDLWFASSMNCLCSGNKVDSMPLKVQSWTCTSCGTEHDRDVNAAINIRQQGVIKLRAEGLSVPANGGLRKPGHAPAVA